MDTQYFTPAKRGAKMANKLNRSFHRIGELKRASRDKVQRVSNTSKDQLQKVHPQEDFSDWSLEECDDFLRRQDHSCDAAGWEDEGSTALPAENPNGSVTIAAESDPAKGIYSPAAVRNLPSEAFSEVIVLVPDLSREHCAELLRICKPGGHYVVGRLKWVQTGSL